MASSIEKMEWPRKTIYGVDPKTDSQLKQGGSDVWRGIDAKEAPRIFLPTITGNKNCFGARSRERSCSRSTKGRTYV
ncbi:hypothetical protein KM043_004157 [Ampulex compressa]|nr:hypothetical protein KM043_004157 [Ampulex compressa]